MLSPLGPGAYLGEILRQVWALHAALLAHAGLSAPAGQEPPPPSSGTPAVWSLCAPLATAIAWCTATLAQECDGSRQQLFQLLPLIVHALTASASASGGASVGAQSEALEACLACMANLVPDPRQLVSAAGNMKVPAASAEVTGCHGDPPPGRAEAGGHWHGPSAGLQVEGPPSSSTAVCDREAMEAQVHTMLAHVVPPVLRVARHQRHCPRVSLRVAYFLRDLSWHRAARPALLSAVPVAVQCLGLHASGRDSDSESDGAPLGCRPGAGHCHSELNRRRGPGSSEPVLVSRAQHAQHWLEFLCNLAGDVRNREAMREATCSGPPAAQGQTRSPQAGATGRLHHRQRRPGSIGVDLVCPSPHRDSQWQPEACNVFLVTLQVLSSHAGDPSVAYPALRLAATLGGLCRQAPGTQAEGALSALRTVQAQLDSDPDQFECLSADRHQWTASAAHTGLRVLLPALEFVGDAASAAIVVRASAEAVASSAPQAALGAPLVPGPQLQVQLEEIKMLADQAVVLLTACQVRRVARWSPLRAAWCSVVALAATVMPPMESLHVDAAALGRAPEVSLPADLVREVQVELRLGGAGDNRASHGAGDHDIARSELSASRQWQVDRPSPTNQPMRGRRGTKRRPPAGGS